MSQPVFSDLPLDPRLRAGLDALGYTAMTPVQAQALPHLLAGRDVIALDEADRMLDMGFEEAVREIVGRTPPARQTLLFSATFPDAIRALGTTLLREPAEVDIGATGAQAPAIEQRFIEVEPAVRTQVLAAALLHHAPETCVVFCNTRRDVDEVAGSLAHYGFGALALHGDMEQRDREEVLVRFANRSCNVLVASDVAARGLDIDDIGAVVNYELPTDADTYLHRIGRTGRAGREGLALSLVAARERPRMMPIEAVLRGAPRWERIAPVAGKPKHVPAATMATLRIDAGRTDKLRPGDIVGALTGEAGLHKDAVGRIDVFATRSYVAVTRAHARATVERLREGRIKGRRFRVSLL